MADTNLTPTPAPTAPDGVTPARIPLPVNANANPFDDAAQKIIREAEARAAARDSTPFRETDPGYLRPVVDPRSPTLLGTGK